MDDGRTPLHLTTSRRLLEGLRTDAMPRTRTTDGRRSIDGIVESNIDGLRSGRDAKMDDGRAPLRFDAGYGLSRGRDAAGTELRAGTRRQGQRWTALLLLTA
jgi:hypothetical protein